MSFTNVLISLFLIALTISIGFILYRNHWIRKFDNYKARARNDLGKELNADFHDEVGSHLAKIINIAGVLRLKTTTEEEGMYLDKIIESSKSMFSSFGTLVWAIQSDRTRCHDVYLEISDFGNKLFDSSDVKFLCRIDEERTPRYMFYTSVKDVTLSIKEIVTNAMRHSQARNINVDFTIDKDLLCVKVTDDGLGFSIDKAKVCGGLINLKKRSERSDFSYTMETSNGSTFLLSIPIEHV